MAPVEVILQRSADIRHNPDDQQEEVFPDSSGIILNPGHSAQLILNGLTTRFEVFTEIDKGERIEVLTVCHQGLRNPSVPHINLEGRQNSLSAQQTTEVENLDEDAGGRLGDGSRFWVKRVFKE